MRLRPLVLPAERLPRRLHAARAARASVFTFSPFEAKKEKEERARAKGRALWARGETVVAVASLSNPLCVPVHVDAIGLSATVIDDPPPAPRWPKPADAAAGDGNSGGGDGGAGGGGGVAPASPGARAARFVAHPRSLTLPPLSVGIELELCGRVEGGLGSGRLFLRGVEASAYAARLRFTYYLSEVYLWRALFLIGTALSAPTQSTRRAAPSSCRARHPPRGEGRLPREPAPPPLLPPRPPRRQLRPSRPRRGQRRPVTRRVRRPVWR